MEVDVEDSFHGLNGSFVDSSSSSVMGSLDTSPAESVDSMSVSENSQDSSDLKNKKKNRIITSHDDFEAFTKLKMIELCSGVSLDGADEFDVTDEHISFAFPASQTDRTEMFDEELNSAGDETMDQDVPGLLEKDHEESVAVNANRPIQNGCSENNVEIVTSPRGEDATPDSSMQTDSASVSSDAGSEVVKRPSISVVPVSRLLADKPQLTSNSTESTQLVKKPSDKAFSNEDFQAQTYTYPPQLDKEEKTKLCFYCGEETTLSISFDFHFNRQRIHIFYNCKPCGSKLEFYNHCQLYAHVLRHPQSERVPISEPDISLFPLKSDVASPNLTEKNEKKFVKILPKTVSTCSECGVPVVSPRDHFFNNRKLTSSAFRCNICRLILPSKCSLQAHTRIHTKRLPYICPECGLQTCSFFHLYNHLQHFCLHFTRGVVFGCPKCESPSKTLAMTESHFSARHIKRIYKCYLCNLAFFDVKSIIDHVTIKHDKPENISAIVYYQCELCPKVVVYANALKMHINRHVMNHRYIYTYDCDTCNYRCPHKGNFVKHKRECKGAGNAKTFDSTKYLESSESLPDKIECTSKISTGPSTSTATENKSENASILLSMLDDTRKVAPLKNEEKSSAKNMEKVVEKLESRDNCGFKNYNFVRGSQQKSLNEFKKMPNINGVRNETESAPQPSVVINSCIECKKPVKVPFSLCRASISFRCSECLEKIYCSKQSNEAQSASTRFPLLGRQLVGGNGYIKQTKQLYRCNYCKSLIKLDANAIKQHFEMKHKEIKIVSLAYEDEKLKITFKPNTLDDTAPKSVNVPRISAGAVSNILPKKNAIENHSVLKSSAFNCSSSDSFSVSNNNPKPPPKDNTSDTSDNDCVVLGVSNPKDNIVEVHDSDSELSDEGQPKHYKSNDFIDNFSHFMAMESDMEKIENPSSCSISGVMESDATANISDPEEIADDDVYVKEVEEKKPTAMKRNRRNRKHKKKVKDNEASESGGGLFFDVENFDCSKEYVRNCYHCSFESKDAEDFFTHIETHRLGHAGYQCMECGVTYFSKNSFRAHLIFKHGVQDVCEYIKRNKNCVMEGEYGTESAVKELEDPEGWECLKLLHASDNGEIYNVEQVAETHNVCNETRNAKASGDESIIDCSSNKKRNKTVRTAVETTDFLCHICKKVFADPIEFNTHSRTHGIAFLKNHIKKY